MPELPDLEVIREFLTPRIVGVSIASVAVRRPIVVRNLLGGDPADHLVDRRFASVGRRGKNLLLPLDSGTQIVINPMLAGRIRYGDPLGRHRKRDVIVLRLDDGTELRYHDAKDMGKVYIAASLDKVPTYATLGPDATDPDLTIQRFRERLRVERGEVKEILTRQSFVAGIGNAYGDEICWRAQIYPFRRKDTLSPDETDRLYTAMRDVLVEAIETLRIRVGTEIDVEVRDFMAVHGKPGQPCPRCNKAISEVSRSGRRPTHFCRTCQPGLIVGSRPPSQRPREQKE